MELGRLEQCCCILLPWICAVLLREKAQPWWEWTHRGRDGLGEASFATFTGRGHNLPMVMNFHTGSGLLLLCPCHKCCVLVPEQSCQETTMLHSNPMASSLPNYIIMKLLFLSNTTALGKKYFLRWD